MQRNYALIKLISKNKNDGYGPQGQPRDVTWVPKENANVITSLVQSNPALHAPCFDIDIPCRLMESKTPGHYHLYIDLIVPERHYKKLLKAMMKAGIIEKGWFDRTMIDGFSTLIFADERTPTEAIIEELDATIRDNSG